MKTKPFLIALFAGIIMLTFASCTDLKIKSVESKVSRLEKNYKDLTKTEFKEDYDDYLDDLNKISEKELTKNQKEKIRDLKYRLRLVWIRYHNPIGQIPFEDNLLLTLEAKANLTKHNLIEGGDTLSLDAYLSKFEKVRYLK